VTSLLDGAGSEGRSGCIATCECGTMKKYIARNLCRGITQSCGCYRGDVSAARRITHGRGHADAARRDPTYTVWRAIIARCTRKDVNSPDYAAYFGRGIGVCARWRDSFEWFALDMGDRPPGRSIDRKDNDGGYWCGKCTECVVNARPSNCRWATPKEQARNRRSSRLITIDGVARCLAEWCELAGLSQSAADGRLRRGWTERDAVSGPRRQRST
jgi:hypothetical protein